MVLLLETAEVLELRARRTRDVAQIPVLLRRADHRRREAAQLRERLAAKGAALPDKALPDKALLAKALLEREPDSQRAFSPASPPGQAAR